MKQPLTHFSAITVILLLLTADLLSQNIRPPFVHDYLHANDIKAAVGQYSNNFWNYDYGKCLVPYEGPESPSTIFASALWISGEDENGNPYVSNEVYTNLLQFLPGPLPEDETPLSESVTLNWNRIFKVSGTDIVAHIEDARDGKVDRPLESIFGWPAAGNEHFEDIHGFAAEYGPEGGAHFVEVPGAMNGVYEPELGEYPHVENLSPDVIPGEMTWAVYNNAHNQRLRYGFDSTMTVEIQQTSYSFDCGSAILSQNIFHNYKVISRTDENLTKFKFGLWIDPDLGCYTDDYIGCDPERSTFYIYNEDAQDGTVGIDCNQGIATYGDQPPVQTATFLDQDMSAFVIYEYRITDPGPGPTELDPSSQQEVLRYMNATWRDGTPMTRGGNGYNPMSTDSVQFVYPDNPNLPGGWSMHQEDLPPADRRCIGIAETSLASGSSQTFTLAFGYHNHPDSTHLSNVNYALNRVDQLQLSFDMGEMGCQPELCSCECVWPGDANNDGREDYLDAVNIIQAFDDNGPTRPSPYKFQPEEVVDWTFASYLDVNSKYADTDGSGEVSVRDLDLLSEYIDRRNYCAIDPVENCPEGDQVYLDYRRSWGDDYPVSFGVFGLKVRSIENFWGISYRLKYDPDLFTLLNDPRTGNWLNDSISKHVFHHRKLENNSMEHQVVFFNDTDQNAEPDNSQDYNASELIFLAHDVPDRYPTQYATIEVCDFTVYYDDGSSEILPTMPARFLLPDSVTTSIPTIMDQTDPVIVYPNPGNGHFTIESSFQVHRVDIFNAQGQLVQTSEGNEVQIRGNGKGIYYFKIYGSDGTTGFSKVIRH